MRFIESFLPKVFWQDTGQIAGLLLERCKMRKTATKVITKQVQRTAKTTKSVDDELAEYLRQAEDALIGAVKLFSGHPRPSRRVDYEKTLKRAQEAITTLYREELVRIRGPIKIWRKK